MDIHIRVCIMFAAGRSLVCILAVVGCIQFLAAALGRDWMVRCVGRMCFVGALGGACLLRISHVGVGGVFFYIYLLRLVNFGEICCIFVSPSEKMYLGLGT